MIYFVSNTENGLQFANTIRNGSIAKKNGALLVREECDGGNKELLEKIIVAEEFKEGTPAQDIPWKSNSTIVLLGKASSKLKEFNEMCPGFEEFFGPVTQITI